jgi:hypothetical protein
MREPASNARAGRQETRKATSFGVILSAVTDRAALDVPPNCATTGDETGDDA